METYELWKCLWFFYIVVFLNLLCRGEEKGEKGGILLLRVLYVVMGHDAALARCVAKKTFPSTSPRRTVTQRQRKKSEKKDKKEEKDKKGGKEVKQP